MAGLPLHGAQWAGRRLLQATAALVFASALPAQPLRSESGAPLRTGEDYRLARSRLLAKGWRLSPRSGVDACSGLPGDQRCARFPELASCAPTGLGLCRFEWRAPDGRAYAVITREGGPDGTPGRIESWFVLP
jgi:hypothetical protein